MKFLEARQLPENGAGIVKNERSDVLSRLGELQGLSMLNSWKLVSCPKIVPEWSEKSVLMPFLGSESFRGSRC